MDVSVEVLWFLGVLSAASFAVWVEVFLRSRRGEPIFAPQTDSPPPIHWMPLFLTLLLVSRNLMSLLASVETSTTFELERVTANIMLSCVMLVLLLVPLLPTRETAVALGFTTDRWRQQLRVGAAGFLASVLPVLICLLATIWMRDPSTEHAYLQALKKDDSLEVLLWICVSAVVIAPILEELLYRVILQTWLQHVIAPRQALVITAAIFAAVHRLPDAIPLFPLALILGYVYQQRRSFLSVVTVHALFNAVNLALDLMSTD